LVTYLISILALSIKFEVFAHLSSEFVYIWRAWGEIVVDVQFVEARRKSGVVGSVGGTVGLEKRSSG